jgi:hypothetical protein
MFFVKSGCFMSGGKLNIQGINFMNGCKLKICGAKVLRNSGKVVSPSSFIVGNRGVAGQRPAEGVAEDRAAGCSEGETSPPPNSLSLSLSSEKTADGD